MANTSLYTLAILDRADAYTGLVEDVTTLAPEFDIIPAHKRSGTWYKIGKRTSLPTAQFRTVNSGIAGSASGYKAEVKEMFFLDTRIQMDEAVEMADQGNLGALWQLEAEGAMRSASILIGAQTWYGTSADSNGFAGVRSQLSFTTAATTGTSTSAYLLWIDEQHGCRYDVGMDGQFAISPPFRQQVNDASSNSYFAYVGNLKAWIGYNQMSNLSAFAVTGITSTLQYWMKDDLGAQLLAQIPVARRQNLRWFMNRSCESYLQRSRSTVNVGINPAGTTSGNLASYQAAGADGRPAFSPLPNQCVGYPITLTDSILNTETN